MFLCLHTEIGFIIVNYLPSKTWSSPHTARKSKSEWMRQAGLQPPRGESEMRTEYCLKVEGMRQLASYKLTWDNN